MDDRRAVVSYDDLYDDEAPPADPSPLPRRLSHHAGRPYHDKSAIGRDHDAPASISSSIEGGGQSVERQVQGEAEGAEEEERLRYDRSRGLFLDSYTGLHFDYASNLYYDLTSTTADVGAPCYHWDPSSSRFLAVLVDRVVRFASLLPRDQAGPEPEPEAAAASVATPDEPRGHGRSAAEDGRRAEDEGRRRDANEAEEGEIAHDEEEGEIVHEEEDEDEREDEDEDEDGESDEEEDEEELRKLAASVRMRGLEERRSWSEAAAVDWKWDATSNTYYDARTGLYYSPASDLYMDYNAFPAATYHRLSREDYVQVTPLEEVQQDQTTEEEDTSIPPKLTLTLKHVDDDIHELGSFVIGDVKRDDDAHKNDTANTKVFTLGRHRTNDIQLDDLVASKSHARITWQNVYWQNFFWLQDLGSNNGTFLNGKRLSESRVPSGEQECPLQINDHIVIGNTKIVVSRVTERPPTPAPPAQTSTTAGGVEGDEEEKKSIFTGNFQPNLNHPIFRALRDSIKEEEERQKRVHAKRKLYQVLTQEEKEDRKRTRERYTDRATRRQRLYKSTAPAGASPHGTATVGRDAPPARLERPGPSPSQRQQEESKGKSLLKRMGWKEGEGLGRDKAGIVDPIQAAMSNFSDTTRGLGFGAGGPGPAAAASTAAGNPATSKDARWERTRERYHKLFGS